MSANMQKTWVLESLDGFNEETKSTLELCLQGQRHFFGLSASSGLVSQQAGQQVQDRL